MRPMYATLFVGLLGFAFGMGSGSDNPSRLFGCLHAAERDRARSPLTLPVPTAEQQASKNVDPIASARFSPSGRYLALGTGSGSSVAMDLERGTLLFALAAHQKPLKLIAFGCSMTSALRKPARIF